jgi:hypothetical protein
MRAALFSLVWLLPVAGLAAETNSAFVNLFPEDGIPNGWVVRKWDDLKAPVGAGVVWKVEKGVLHGSEPRGTWLVSEKEYGDFILEFDWKLGQRGNSGAALRAPMFGDPAFDGLELQMLDPRYVPTNSLLGPAEVTGSLYRAVPPRVQAFKPLAWNHYSITCRGASVRVLLNGQSILDADLGQELQPATRHDGTKARPLKDRPRRGHLGFQELSRDGQVEIRNARIRVLD